jgi:hypothetical protein
MATSTLIQKLDSTALVTSTTIPGGYQSVETPDVSDRRQIETFITSEIVFIGDVVCLDLVTAGLNATERGVRILRAQSTNTSKRTVVGVVVRSADSAAGAFTPSSGACAAGTKVEVVVRGIVNASSLACTVGDVLALDPAGAVGAVDTITAATNVKVGYALSTVAAPGLAPIFVVGNF